MLRSQQSVTQFLCAANYKQVKCLVRKASKERDPFCIDFTRTTLKEKKYLSPWLQLQTMRIVTRTETLFLMTLTCLLHRRYLFSTSIIITLLRASARRDLNNYRQQLGAHFIIPWLMSSFCRIQVYEI